MGNESEKTWQLTEAEANAMMDDKSPIMCCCGMAIFAARCPSCWREMPDLNGGMTETDCWLLFQHEIAKRGAVSENEGLDVWRGIVKNATGRGWLSPLLAEVLADILPSKSEIKKVRRMRVISQGART